MSQVFKSEYGRKGIRVADACPTRAVAYHLSLTHVGRPMAKVEAEVRAEIEKMKVKVPKERAAWTESMVRDTLRFTAWQHEENRAEYRYVMGGTT